MIHPLSKAPDPWDCVVFISVVQEGSYEAAARKLKSLRGGYSRQAVRQVIGKIEDWAGQPLLAKSDRGKRFFPTARGQHILEAMRRVVAQYEVMRAPSSPSSGLTLACHPHHTHFVALAEDQLRGPDGWGEELRVEYLAQHQRGEGEFHLQAVGRLLSGEYQLIIGPRVEMDAVVSHGLYRAQLEVMIDADFPAESISLADLVAKHRMFVPPTDMRSRMLLEDCIAESGVPDPGVESRIAGETYETATSVMRLRNEHRAGDKSRVVVVPSDVALAYKVGREFGGLHAERFKWIPIYRRDSNGAAQALHMDVCVTVYKAQSGKLAHIIEALREGVKRLEGSSEHGGLSGRPFGRR